MIYLHSNTRYAHRSRQWPYLTLAICLIAILLGAGSAHAQLPTIALTVQLLDTADRPVPGASVRILDAVSNQALAQGVTNELGQALFPDLYPGAIRVVISGSLPDGTELRLLDQDARGIWVQLPGSHWRMELRTDVDGVVFPDLSAAGAGAVDGLDATAIAQGTFDTPPAASPSQLAATPGPRPTPLKAALSAPAVVTNDATQEDATETSSHWFGWTLFAGIMLVIGAIGISIFREQEW